LVYWALRRDRLCDPNLCPDSPGRGERCAHCPLDRLDAAQSSEAGQLLRRALDLRAMLKVGIRLSLEDIAADELYAVLVIEEEQNRYDNERAQER
jgi:hypothetical protein